jgi:hypothetical protein
MGNPYIRQNFIQGNDKNDATVGFGNNNVTNDRTALRNAIYELRRALWRVESSLQMLEQQAHGVIDDEKMQPRMSEMFMGLKKVLEAFYGLSVGIYGVKFTAKVVEALSQPFDYIRKFQ